jgi:hypothetical protein
MKRENREKRDKERNRENIENKKMRNKEAGGKERREKRGKGIYVPMEEGEKGKELNNERFSRLINEICFSDMAPWPSLLLCLFFFF